MFDNVYHCMRTAFISITTGCLVGGLESHLYRVLSSSRPYNVFQTGLVSLLPKTGGFSSLR